MITEVTVRLVPKPCWRVASWPALTTCAWRATPWRASLLRRHHPGRAGDDGQAHDRRRGTLSTPATTCAEAILLCESDGTPEEVEEEIRRMSEVLRGCGATAIAVSRDEAERLRFWSGRKTPFRPADASAPTTCAWTPPSPGSAWPTSCWPSRRWRKVPAALRQRVPCGRRQPAPTDSVRCQRR